MTEKKTREFVEAWSLNELRKRGVTLSEGWIVVKSGSLGIRMLSHIDFLVNHCGHKVSFR